jgi:hypothetical protein
MVSEGGGGGGFASALFQAIGDDEEGYDYSEIEIREVLEKAVNEVLLHGMRKRQSASCLLAHQSELRLYLSRFIDVRSSGCGSGGGSTSTNCIEDEFYLRQFHSETLSLEKNSLSLYNDRHLFDYCMAQGAGIHEYETHYTLSMGDLYEHFFERRDNVATPLYRARITNLLKLFTTQSIDRATYNRLRLLLKTYRAQRHYKRRLNSSYYSQLFHDRTVGEVKAILEQEELGRIRDLRDNSSHQIRCSTLYSYLLIYREQSPNDGKMSYLDLSTSAKYDHLVMDEQTMTLLLHTEFYQYHRLISLSDNDEGEVDVASATPPTLHVIVETRQMLNQRLNSVVSLVEHRFPFVFENKAESRDFILSTLLNIDSELKVSRFLAVSEPATVLVCLEGQIAPIASQEDNEQALGAIRMMEDYRRRISYISV